MVRIAGFTVLPNPWQATGLAGQDCSKVMFICLLLGAGCLFTLPVHGQQPVERELAATRESESLRFATVSLSGEDDLATKIVGDKLPGERPTVEAAGGGKLTLYGYGRLDLISSDSRLSNTVVPFFVLPEGGPGSVPVNDGQFNTNVRLTRLGIDFLDTEPGWLGATLGGKVEIDFETLMNITSESRAIPRIRLAYGEMRWENFSLLLGQDWDVISPLNPMINDDSLMWNAGNLGDRRPMLRGMWSPGLDAGKAGTGMVIAGAISSGGAIDQQDLDGNGIKDGEDSGRPALQGRIGYNAASRIPQRQIGLGIWGLLGFESMETPIAGNDDFYTGGIGFDAVVPLTEKWTLRGEGWWGQNLSDWRGGIAQGVNTVTGQEIHSRGGWIEVQRQAHKTHVLALGLTADDPADSDLAGNATDRSLNWTWYVGNRFHLAGGVTIYLNAEFWTTEYLAHNDGDAGRVKAVFIKRF